MLVTRIIGDCPGCNSKNSFGNADVFGTTLQRGCHHCEYSVLIPLPEITKSILYLDQSFFSHAFNEGDEKCVTSAHRIAEAAHQQLLTTPYSSLHEEETPIIGRCRAGKPGELQDDESHILIDLPDSRPGTRAQSDFTHNGHSSKAIP